MIVMAEQEREFDAGEFLSSEDRQSLRWLAEDLGLSVRVLIAEVVKHELRVQRGDRVDWSPMIRAQQQEQWRRVAGRHASAKGDREGQRHVREED